MNTRTDAAKVYEKSTKNIEVDHASRVNRYSRKLSRFRARLTLQWKLTLWSAFILFVLLAGYSGAQYVFVERWTVASEQERMGKTMQQILNHLLAREYDPEGKDYAEVRTYLQSMNQPGQIIRLLDKQGQPVVEVKQDMPMGLSEEEMVTRRGTLTIFRFEGTVEIVRSMKHYEELITTVWKIMLICLAAAVLLSGAGGWLLARGLRKPLRELNETMRRVRDRGLQERVGISGARDELQELGLMFNEMMEQVEQTFARQRQFVEDASHELRTPIAILEGHLRMLQRWGSKDEAILTESLGISLEELSRLKQLAQELLALTRAEAENAGTIESCDQPERSVRRIVHNLRMLHPTFDWHLKLEPLEGKRLALSSRKLEQLLIILLDNAIKYSGDIRSISIIADVTSNESITLIVADRGKGIVAEELPHVWDRFYREDKARSGSAGGYGLGLAIARVLVEKAGGEITISSELGEGTAVTVHLPLYQGLGHGGQ